MGYALMSARKVMLTSKINRLNFQLTCISQAYDAMASKMGNLQRLMNAYTNWNSTMQQANLLQMVGNNGNLQQVFANMIGGGCSGSNNYLSSLCGGNSGMMGLLSGLFGSGYSAPTMGDETFMKMFWPYAQCQMIEDDLDAQKNMIQTQLKAAEEELKNVEQGEDAAIKRSTPKYA